MPAENGRYVSAAKAADLLHVSPKTVSRWAKVGLLPFQKTLGGHRRYPVAWLEAKAASLRAEATEEREGAAS